MLSNMIITFTLTKEGWRLRKIREDIHR